MERDRKKENERTKENKKAFQSNANRPLSKSKYYIVNKFEQVIYSEVQFE